MIKRIILGVLLTLVGLTIAVVSLANGWLNGGVLGIVIVLVVSAPIAVILLHRYASHMPAVLLGTYTLIATLFFWITTFFTLQTNPPAAASVFPSILLLKILLYAFSFGLLVVGLSTLATVFLPQLRTKVFATLTLFDLIMRVTVGVYMAAFIISAWSLIAYFKAGLGWGLAAWLGWTVLLPLILMMVIGGIPLWLLELTESDKAREAFMSGEGGSARWAGPITLNKSRVSIENRRIKPKVHSEFGTIFLGETLPQDTTEPHFVGVTDDVHMVTIGMTGTGKSATAIFNNLPYWAGDIIAIDPKGELAKYSAVHRKKNRNNEVYVLDPFGVANVPTDLKAGYNPLAEIDVHANGATRFIQGLTDACVISEGERNIHFTETARNFIDGLVAHVLSTRPKHQQNLPYLFDMLIGIGDADKSESSNLIENFERLLDEMSANMVCGGLPAQGAKQIRDSGNEAYGSLLSTTQRSLKWVSDPEMRKQLNPSQHGMRELRLKSIGYYPRSSIYIVLPFDYLPIEKQGRWMRLLVNFGLSAVQILPEPPSPQVLFIIDEFYSLGYFKRISDGIVQLRSAGVKLWLFVQNVGQLKELYGDNWEGFSGSANVQILGVKDNVTAQWISRQIGDRKNGNALITASEVIGRLQKDAKRQIILPVSGFPMQLRSVFYKDFVPPEDRNG